MGRPITVRLVSHQFCMYIFVASLCSDFLLKKYGDENSIMKSKREMMAKAMTGQTLVDIVVAEFAMTCASCVADLARRG